MKKIVASTLFALLLPFANASLAEDICHNPQAERDILECSAQKKDEAEVLLNKQFSEAKKTVQHAYRTQEELGKQYFSVLLDGQRGWLKYRDAQCKLEAFAAEEGTSANAIANNECIARLDNDRSENLKKVPY
ncbi:lysozyme inhibitor LprI family protein [Kalamiella sp. sgz302252]|uniref:lysozyme inhibitor LprI family protein n=1 Tax=Pantoea sp. sgz302252 TaxID=3341827 RepID=UPI0036D32A0B